MTLRHTVPEPIEAFRDHHWHRDSLYPIDTAAAAERFVERVGFSACLSDSRRPGPSLYVAVCGRRDAVLPRHVRHDPEASLTWTLKDQIAQRGTIYYGKLARGRAMFLAPRLVPVLSRHLGHPPRRGIGAPQPTGTEDSGRPPSRMGDGNG